MMVTIKFIVVLKLELFRKIRWVAIGDTQLEYLAVMSVACIIVKEILLLKIKCCTDLIIKTLLWYRSSIILLSVVVHIGNTTASR